MKIDGHDHLGDAYCHLEEYKAQIKEHPELVDCADAYILSDVEDLVNELEDIIEG